LTWREQLVGEVITLLNPLGANALAKVERMPEAPSFALFAHPKAAVWVGYHGGRQDKAIDISGSAQNRTVRFDLALLTRKLSGPIGALNLMDLVEELCVGKRLSRGGPLYWADDEYASTANGVWHYDVQLSMNLVSVPSATLSPSDPTLGPALKYALLENEVSGDTSVGTDPELGP
jgi:hypothetical protein